MSLGQLAPTNGLNSLTNGLKCPIWTHIRKFFTGFLPNTVNNAGRRPPEPDDEVFVTSLSVSLPRQKMKISLLFKVLLTVPLLSCIAGNADGEEGGETSNNGGTFVWHVGDWTFGVPTISTTAFIFGGIVTVDGTVSSGRIRLTGGSLIGATNAATDSLTLAGAPANSVWSGGTIRDLSIVISQNAALDLSGSGTKSFSGAILDINTGEEVKGSANWKAGEIQLNNGSKIENSGYFNDSASDTMRTFTGTLGEFNNLDTGKYNKTATGTTEIDVKFNNSGNVNVTNGTLVLDGGGESSSTGYFNISTGATLRFDNDYSIINASNISGSGQAELTNGTLTLNGDVNTSDFAIKGGTLSGTHTFNSSATWTEGLLKDGSTTNGADSFFNIQSTADNNLNNHTFNNAGTINWTDSDIVVDSGSSINNSGTFNDSISADHEIRRFTGNAFVFTNSGTYQKSGSAKTEIDQEFNNSGNVNIDSGILVLDGGGTASSTGAFSLGSTGTLRFDNDYTITDASKITGIGQAELTFGTLTLDGDVNATNFAIKGGVLTGTHTFKNGAKWTEGVLKNGSTTNASGSTFTLESTSDNNLDGHLFANAGTVNWSDGDIQVDNGTTINNSGTFIDSLSDDHEIRRFTGNVMIFNNSGIFHKTGSAKTEIDQEFNNSGSVDIDSGVFVLDGGGEASGSFTVGSVATLRIDNNYALSNAAGVTGTGQVELTSGILTMNGEVNVPNFAIKGGTLTGTHTFKNGAAWTDGVLKDGSTTNASGSTFTLESTVDNDLDGHALINAGTINWTDGDIKTSNGAILNNSGTFNDSIADDHEFRRFTGGVTDFTNTGTYHKTGSAKTEFDQTFTNSGAVDLDAGTFVIDGGGSTSSTGSFDVATGATLRFDNNYSVADASKITGSGQVELTNGTLALSGTVNVSDFAIKGGKLSHTQIFQNGATWSEGVLSNGSTFNLSGSTFNIQSTVENNIDGKTFNNSGTTNWIDGDIVLDNNSSIINSGTFNDSIIDDHEIRRFTGTTGVFTNSGTYHKTGSAKTDIDQEFNNSGTVDVDAGTLVIDGTGEASSTGAFDVASGATLQFDNNYIIADAAKLTGAGKYLHTFGDLELDGVLSVDFEQDGGFTLIDGSFQIGGTFDWKDGTWDAAADGETTTINSSGLLNLEDTISSYKNRDIINNGTVNWTGGTLRTDGNGSFTNNGIFKDASDSDHTLTESSGDSSFTNQGTYLKTGAGTTRIDQSFTNSSPTTVEVRNGVLALNGGGTNYSSGSMVVKNTGMIQFANNFKIENAARLSTSALSGTHGYELTAGDLDLDGTLSVDFVQTGGELDGTHNIAAQYDWNGGNLNADVDGESTTIFSTGVLNINVSTLNAEFDNRDITNQGTVNWTDGNLLSDAQGSFANNGTFNDKLDHNHIFSGAPSFSNTGTYTKSDVGITEFDSDFDNDGNVNVNAGTLILDGGGLAGSMGTFNVGAAGTLQFDNDYSITEASNLSGGGKFLLANGNLALDGNLSADFEQTGGNLDGSQVISGTFDLGGFGDWDATSDGSTTQITSSGVLNITGNSRTFDNRDITNQGTVNWDDGDLGTNAAGSFDNQGTFNDRTDHNHDIEESAGSAIFTNSGTFDKSGNSTTTIRQDFVNTGDLEVHQGTLVLADDNSHSSSSTIAVDDGAQITLSANTTLSKDADIHGQGTIKQTGSTLSGESNIGTRFEKTGGILSGDFVFSDVFDMTGGTVAANSVIELMGNSISSIDVSSLSLDGSTLKVGSGTTLNWTRGSIHTGNDGLIDIDGIFINNFDGSITQSLTGNGSMDVSGSFRKTAGTGVTTISLPATISGRFEAHTGSVTFSEAGVSNGGLFDVWSGAEMNFTNGFTFNTGTTVPNGGDFNLKSGIFAINDTVSLGGHASVSGGTLTGTHTLSGNVVVNGGSFDSSGTTTIATDGELELAHVEANLLPRSFVNNGKITWSAGDLTGSGGNSLTNEGEFSITTDGTFNADADDFTLVNNGTIKKTNSTGTTTIDVPFTNNGLVTALTGNFHFTDTLTFGSGGKLGGGVQFDAPLTLPADSTLQGNGTITGSITTSGTVSPGNSIGSLTITGDLTLLSSANTFVEVDASTTPGAADLVTVSGNLTLGGNLSWNLLSTLDPVTTSMFTLFTANNLSGAFSNAAHGTRLSTADGHRSFIVNYGASSSFSPNSVIFSNFEFTPVPEPSAWALMFTGLMIITWQSRRRRA